MTPQTLCVLALLCVAVCGCSERYVPSPAATTPSQPAQTASQTRLFDIGDNPKAVWASIQAGFVQRLTWHPTIDGQVWRVVAEVAVNAVLPSGDWVVEQTLLEVAADAPFDLPPSARTQQWTLSASKRSALSPAEEPLRTLHNQLQQLALRFPPEVIGEGAFWDASLSDTLAVGMVLESFANNQAQVRVDWPSDPSIPAVRLIWGGQDPRTPLQYRPVVGTSESIKVTFSDTTARAGERASVGLNPASSQVSLTITEIPPDGTIHYIGQVLPQDAKTPIAFQGVLFPNASPLTEDQKPTQTLWADTRVVALPNEPVGLGARWAVRSPVTFGPWTLHRTAIYTLDHVEGDTIRLKVDAKQYALSPQHFSVDGPRKKLGLQLNALDATETGSITLDLTRLLPTANIQLRLQMWITTQGAEHPTYTETHSTLSLQPTSETP